MPGHRIRFLPAGKSSLFHEGTPVRDAALELGILIDSTCAGIGTCGRCKVELRSGANQPTPVERQVLSAAEIEAGVRLSCQSTISADTTCVVPEASLAAVAHVAVAGLAGDYPLDPETVKSAITLSKPTFGSAASVADMARKALAASGVEAAPPPERALDSLAASTRKSWGTVTATVDAGTVTGFEPGDTSENLYGLAIDIGTTTLAMKLVDLHDGLVLGVATSANPQAALGADVVARIQYAINHAGGARKLRRLVLDRLSVMVREVADDAGIDHRAIAKVVVVGNTVMQHLLLGLETRHLGVKPYLAMTTRSIRRSASDFGLPVSESGAVYVAPNLRSFVGSDITAALVALRLGRFEKPALVVDMGTNGEMVLSHAGRLTCCSSPAGPAWEGACISWGMRASRGAIERVEIEQGQVMFRTVGGGEPVGICGSGLIDVVCALRANGVLNASGRLPAASDLNGIEAALARRLGDLEDGGREFRIVQTADHDWISVTQEDIRQIQLAKAGIAAGVESLLADAGLAPVDLDTVFIAGAFGNHLRGDDVSALGLVTGVESDRIRFVGNAALAGAEAMLRSREAVWEAERIAESIEYVEVAAESGFQDSFVDAITFPPQLTKR